MPTLETVTLKAQPTVIPSVLAQKTASVLEGHQPTAVLSANIPSVSAPIAEAQGFASLSERSGAVSDNSSSKGLLREGSAHLSRSPLAHPKDDAKVKQYPHPSNEFLLTSLADRNNLGRWHRYSEFISIFALLLAPPFLADVSCG